MSHSDLVAENKALREMLRQYVIREINGAGIGEWQTLSHDEIEELALTQPGTFKFARALEAALKEKNT